MFDWLNDIFDFLWSLLPQMELLTPTEGGVKFKPGGRIVLLRPGHLYWYWPITTSVVTLETRRQSVEVEQTLTTKDGFSVSVYTVVVYTVDDVEKALVETTDFDDTIEEMAQKGTVKAVMAREFVTILESLVEGTEMRNELTRGSRSALHPFGVKVEEAFISSFAETRVFSHNGAVFGGDYGEE